MRPSTARELWTRLTALFPGFTEYHTLAELEESERDDTATLHSVMFPFTQFFGGRHTTFTDKQLSTLGTLLNESVAVEDDLENAVSTCFLEHLHQIRGYKVLARHI
jgi:hypothetical protein